MVENETRKKLNCTISDNGGEYCSKYFDRYDSKHGILRENIVPGTMLERMNRTIMEHTSCMRLHLGFPLQFWEHVVDTIFYLVNRGPSSYLDGGIGEEAWTRKR